MSKKKSITIETSEGCFKFALKKSNNVESSYKFFSYHKWLGIVI